MSMEWWRCKHGAPYDPKWRAVAARAGAGIRPGDVWAVFTALCDRASQAADRGGLDGLDAEDVAAGLGYELEQVNSIIAALKAKSLIDDERVTTWEKHQPKREDDGAAERKRKERDRAATIAAGVAALVTDDVSRTVTQSHSREEKIRLDTDTDTDSDQKQKEKGEERSQTRATPSKPVPALDAESFTGKQKRACRWPENAVVPDAWLELGRRRREAAGLPEVDLRLQAQLFQNHWASKSGADATKNDWEKTWVNWCLRSFDDRRSGKNGATGHPFGIFGPVLEKERRREAAEAAEHKTEPG